MGNMICTNCYYHGKPGMKGSLLVALFLLLLGILPGILYIIVMSINASNFCPKCKKNDMIPENSPRGLELLEKIKVNKIEA